MNIANSTNQPKGSPSDKDTTGIAKKSGQEDNLNNAVRDEEAQNVTDGAERLSGEDAEHAKNKATQGGKGNAGS